jgi:hypothetical protein
MMTLYSGTSAPQVVLLHTSEPLDDDTERMSTGAEVVGSIKPMNQRRGKSASPVGGEENSSWRVEGVECTF